jgi:hypothetical protein
MTLMFAYITTPENYVFIIGIFGFSGNHQAAGDAKR